MGGEEKPAKPSKVYDDFPDGRTVVFETEEEWNALVRHFYQLAKLDERRKRKEAAEHLEKIDAVPTSATIEIEAGNRRSKSLNEETSSQYFPAMEKTLRFSVPPLLRGLPGYPCIGLTP